MRSPVASPPIRDRSVVTSSVIPSAKYCCSGSLLRLANGNTTIDRRRATMGCAMDAAVGTAVTVCMGGELVTGQNHQAPAARPRATGAAVALQWRPLLQ